MVNGKLKNTMMNGELRMVNEKDNSQFTTHNSQFKKTEIGVIPKDWEVKSLEDNIDLLTGFPFPSNKYSKSGTKLLRGSNVKRGIIDWSSDITQYWEKIIPEHKMYLLKEGDIVIAMDGSLVGRSFARLSQNDLPALLLQRVARIRSNSMDMGYLKELVCSKYFTEYCDTVKTVTAIPHISPSDIKNYKVPAPPTKEEQSAIAEVLSDTDNLIQSLEKRIAKKRQIKQGAMQKLLTPKEDWEVKKLGEILKVRHGKSQKDVEDRNGQYPILGTGGLMGYGNQFLYDRKSVLIGRKGTIDKPRYMDIPFWTVDTLFYTEIFKCISPKYLFYKFLQIDWYSYNEASGVPSLNAKTIENIEISVPPLEEQTHIAIILSDMDAEIETLEKKLAKHKQLKQGLMQNLLTGKIRLV